MFILDNTHVAAFYGNGKLFVIPTQHRGPFPYCEMKESEIERMKGLYEVLKKERSPESAKAFMEFAEELFARTGAHKERYTIFRAVDLPGKFKGCRIWPDI